MILMKTKKVNQYAGVHLVCERHNQKHLIYEENENL